MSECIGDTKKQVKQAAITCMTEATTVVGNRDIEPVLGEVVNCIVNPGETKEVVHKLAGTTFVQTVEMPAMSIIVPLLVRGLRERETAVKRQTSTIIENMSKLVENAQAAAPFLPRLIPALDKAAETVADPEARDVCARALDQLKRLEAKCAELEAAGIAVKVEHAKVLGALKTGLKLGDVDASTACTLDFVAEMMCVRVDARSFIPKMWTDMCLPLLVPHVADDAAARAAIDAARAECEKMVEVAAEEEDDDDAEELCNCEFTLAYGTKILLHNTKMKLKRGFRYGLLGKNDSGKTTLMRSIANGMVEGFPSPDEVRTVFVEADILGELSHLNCADYVFEDPRIQSYGISMELVKEKLNIVGFNVVGAPQSTDPITTLSGGWRMKLALARAMLQKADILLLDEPTNHLDVRNVKWVKDYLMGLKDVTSIMVSHDSGLLTDVCTHMLEIDNLKLQLYKGNLTELIRVRPDAKAYFEFKATKLKFHFPVPGPIEGVKSKGKALIKVQNVSFKYPRNEINTIEKATVQVSLSSRVACVGPNGAGKSTLIKVLTGETEPTTGEVWRHPNARIGYIAQHAFHHIESHLNKTPNEYIRWRYSGGEDKEAIVKDTMVVTDEERAMMDKPIEISVKNEETGKVTKFKRVIQRLTGERRENKAKQLEYSVKWTGIDETENLQWVAAKTLEKQMWGKHMKKVDMKINMMKGVYNRPLTQANVEKHLEDVGLDREFGSHYRISALSGGQKVKVVLGGALWMQPHLIILDEPTNYLDRESLGALAGAIQEFDGGVVIISHNNDFCQMLCPETWVVEKDEDGISRPNCKGDPEWMKHAMETKVNDQQQLDEVVDAAGNVTKLKKKKDVKKLNKKEQKKMMELVKKKIADADDLDTDEEEFAQLYDL